MHDRRDVGSDGVDGSVVEQNVIVVIDAYLSHHEQRLVQNVMRGCHHENRLWVAP